jgi:uncharacterized protein involved in exopolysaccharide biosynthesis/Mrp family chromosome partitioning ATPase
MSPAEQPPQPSPGLPISPEDVISTLFRHKWKIIFFTLMGIAAAGILYVIDKPKFESRAKILIRYVTESRAVASAADGKADIVRDPDPMGSTIMNSEAEILQSSDLVLATVRALGAEKILAAYGGGSNPYDAAAVLMSGIKLDPGRQSRVLTITLLHRDPKVAQEALKAFIHEYRDRHVAIHRSIGAYDDLQAERDQLRASVLQLEDQLRKEKNKAGVISLEPAKLDIAQQLSSLRKDLYEARAEFAQRKAELEEQERFVARPVSSAQADGQGTNQTGTVPEKALDPARTAEYQSLVQNLTNLRQSERESLTWLTTNSARVVQVQKQIRTVEEAIRNLGFDPALVKASPVARLTPEAGEESYNIEDGRARMRGLEARIKSLEQAHEEVRQKAERLDASENEILRLERQKKVEEDKLAVYESNLERAKFDQTLDSSKINNITVIEEPTVGAKDLKKLKKKLAMALGGAIAAGLALAFGLEFFLDRSVKRPREMEQALQMPLFATIPFAKGEALALPRESEVIDGAGPMALVPIGPGIAPWEESDGIFSYYAALCDRLVMSYRGDSHKPKIIGFTGCHHGAGVTRLASGVAAALSRDLDRHVLYVGLERKRVSVATFQKGRPSDPLESEAIAVLNGHQKEICENLTSMVQTGRSASGAGLVQGLSDLLPKLETTDYDYIVLDLPPLTPTSGSIRLAAQCERVILVAEAEKTPKDDLVQAKALLAAAGTNIFTVLNKTKAYGPLAKKLVS